MSPEQIVNWSLWKSTNRGPTTMRDLGGSPIEVQDSWHVYRPRLGHVNIYLIGGKYFITATHRWETQHVSPYGSFDGAALAGVLRVEGMIERFRDSARRNRNYRKRIEKKRPNNVKEERR